jgi:HAMP domain-containing protein
MLVICEDCAKKYSIDDKRIKAPKVKFTCRACNHIIVIEKPKDTQESQSDIPALSLPSNVPQQTDNSLHEQNTQEHQEKEIPPSKTVRAALRHSAAVSGKGTPFFFYLLTVMLIGFLIITVFFTHFYLDNIPDILQHQLEMRSLSLTESLQGAITRSLAKKDYLRMGNRVRRASKLPGVAYIAVSNDQGKVIAGFFSNLNKFNKHFAHKIKEKGFKLNLLTTSTTSICEKWAGAQERIGGVPVYTRVTNLSGTDSKLHIGLYVEKLDQRFLNTLLSPFTLLLLALFFLSAYILFILLDKLVTEPMRSLTNTANRISLGELDLAIMIKGPRETRELGAALERMRHSIKVAMDRLN